MKFSELDQSLRQAHGEYIKERWKQLYELQKDWGEKSLNYLMLTNSGGAVATLGFIGASHGSVSTNIKVALFIFLLGVVLVGAAHAHTYHRMSSLFKNWRTDVGNYYSDGLSWEELRDKDTGRTGTNVWDYLLPYTAFACFASGGIIGGWAFLSS